MKVGYQPVVIFVRADPMLKQRLQVEADQNERTLNAEIVYRLRRSLEGYSR